MLPAYKFFNGNLGRDVSYVGKKPEMAVSRSGALADAGTDALGAVAVEARVLQYTISNTAQGALRLGAFPAAGALVNCTVDITDQPKYFIAGGNSDTATITVTPSGAGVFSCTVSIANNDANENPYNWTISGTAA